MEILLMLAGALVSYLLIQKLYRNIWLNGLTADIKFSTDYASPGDIVELHEVVTNNKWLPIPFINVKFQLDRNLKFETLDGNSVISDRSYKNDVFSLLFYQRVTRTIPLVCTRRGYYTIDKMDLISMGIFMNEILNVTKPMESELVVYPSPANTRWIEVPYRKIIGEIITKRYTYTDPFEFRGIRDYQIYDSMDTINWKATAKTGDLKVNLHENTASQEVCILLNLEYEGMLRYDALMEESISIAGSLMQMLIEANVSVSILCNGKDILTNENLFFQYGNGYDYINRIYLALAKLDLNKQADDFTEILLDYSSKISKDALYVLVSTCKKSGLQSEYNRICSESTGSIWIVPYHDNMDWEPKGCNVPEIIPWEVPYYE